MVKKSYKDPLSEDQRKTLRELHNTQITLEVALTVFILAMFTVNVSSAFPGYGIGAFLALGLSGFLIFLCGIVLTMRVATLKRLHSPIAKYSRNVQRWIRAVWLCIPLMILFFILSANSKHAEMLIIYLILAGIVVLFMIAAIICLLIGLQRIWRRFNRKKQRPIRTVSYGVIALIMLLLALLGSYTTTEAVQFHSTSVTDSNLELGQTEVRQVGKVGQKQTKHSLIFGTPLSISGTEPVDEIIAKGSRRYQYMYCSNGSSRYFPADQFKDPNVGFTHQSPDFCAQNGEGTQTTLADVPPAEKIIQQVPTYRSPTYTTCTESYFGSSFTCRSF